MRNFTIFVFLSLFFIPFSYTVNEFSIAYLYQHCNKFPPFAIMPQACISKYDLFETTNKFIEQMHLAYGNSSCWLMHDIQRFPLPSMQANHVAPLAQKVTVEPGSEIALWGDLHGSIHSLLRTLLTLKDRGYLDDNGHICKNNFYMFFLGDFVDRGSYGAEVLYVLMQLKLANPDRVFLVRGNHEDCSINLHGGFARELTKKFGLLLQEQMQIYVIYDLLPVVLYLCCKTDNKTHCFQCCHGGMELGYNPTDLLHSSLPIQFEQITLLKRASNLMQLTHEIQQALCAHIPNNKLCDDRPHEPCNIGFLWNDFYVDHGEHVVGYQSQRGWIYGKSLTEALLQQASSDIVSLVGIIRAHQHHGKMLELLCAYKGIVSLWDGIVITLLSAPAMAEHCEFSYDSFALLKTAPVFRNWRLEHVVQSLNANESTMH